MSRRPSGLLAAAIVAAGLALPAAAGAAIGGPYQLSGAAGTLSAQPTAGGSTLVVQAQLTASGVEFAPAAVAPLPAGCSNITVAGRTTCLPASISIALVFSGQIVEAQAHGVTTAQVRFLPTGVANDSLLVDGAGVVGTVAVDPGAGSDSITVAGAVSALTLLNPDPGDDRYDIQSTGLGVETLALGAGADVAASRSKNVTLDGGPGDDTLSGDGPLVGGGDDDLIEPRVTDQIAQGDAGDDRLSFDLISTGLVLTKSGTDVHVAGPTKTGIERLEGSLGDDQIFGDGGADILSGGDGNDTIAGGGGSDTLDGGPGVNTVSYAAGPSPINVDLAAGTATSGASVDHLTAFRKVVTGPGNDTVLGTAADEVFDLGDGADSLNAGPGNDAAFGEAGDDLLRGGHGTDTIDGGPGHDTATYDERTVSEPVSVTLATPGDDGAPGENDTLTGIEDVIGGASSDVLGGDDGPNLLVGGGGLNTLSGGAGDDVLIGGDFRDVINGGPGFDQLIGGGDDDSIDAFDGGPDIVDCGPSLDDDAQVDAADQVTGCEFARRGDVPVPVDADGDGSVAGFDCDDNNPAIGLAAFDIPGDGIDQNCDGFDDPLTLVSSAVQFNYAAPLRSGTRLTQLAVTKLQAGTTVAVTCKTPKGKVPLSRRCPFTRRSAAPKGKGTQVSFTTAIRRRALAVGTTVELRITAPGVVGSVVRIVVRRLAAPRRDPDRCLLPGSTVVKKCPANLL